MEIKEIPAKTIITRTKDESWFGTRYNMNIYKGCCHGCIYCDSRSACYQIENFDEVRVKANALTLIRDELRRKTQKGIIGTGSMSDPYNPIEQKAQLTRQALELISAYDFGVAIATKSSLIKRDIDILKAIKQNAPVITKITVTAAEDTLAKKVEPYVCPSSERFEAVRALSEEGIFTGILMMPVLPFIEDHEENIYQIVKQAHESGAKFIYPAMGMTLRQQQREYFYEHLDKEFPGIKEKYMSYYGENYMCTSPNAKALWKLFSTECEIRGIVYRMQDIIHLAKKGYGSLQLSLFE